MQKREFYRYAQVDFDFGKVHIVRWLSYCQVGEKISVGPCNRFSKEPQPSVLPGTPFLDYPLSVPEGNSNWPDCKADRSWNPAAPRFVIQLTIWAVPGSQYTVSISCLARESLIAPILIRKCLSSTNLVEWTASTSPLLSTKEKIGKHVADKESSSQRRCFI